MLIWVPVNTSSSIPVLKHNNWPVLKHKSNKFAGSKTREGISLFYLLTKTITIRAGDF